ncbi:ABC transporter ATP-binding protein [Streptomyces hiroshimensis]|uniref:Oligopeptide ABC transporter ATP-binding protein OppF n=1 Tax=Streptomyces hiroshimensis TaxID=66424 RepID=A0ABQ2YSC0_9ACTN|nr:ABC transporter ATP-binding protein [Streptomyces hiroshimensis]GGX90877.1 oligopeptide ABC transporter ATP-binding protein OppF [Streptomyces hiroshimensis]
MTAPPADAVTPARTAALAVRDLHVDFDGPEGPVPAVRGVDLTLNPGEVLGLVGESGSGKSTVALAAMGLLPRTARVRGSVLAGGTELLGAGEKALSRLRGSRVAMVFQDPLSALTPVHRIGDQIAEAVRVHQDVTREQARRRAVELLDLVGIPDPARRARAYPHEFSGGMRQRAVIAMAVANDPDVILADEPTTALDVTVQAQILDVLRTARRETGAALLLVSHDLGVIAGMADRVAVMYAGRVVESAPVDALFAAPRMPYTIGLLGAVPRPDTGGRPLTPVPGSPPDLRKLSGGCPFAPRCPLADDACGDEPALTGTGDDHDHLAACVKTPGPGLYPVPEIPPATAGAEAPRSERPAVLRVQGLAKTFPVFKGTAFRRRVGSVYAVDGIDLDIRRGETLGLVGESGSGKSTALMEILRLAAPEAGEVEILGRSAAGLTKRQAHALRGSVQIVFQDPMASLDPRMPVGEIVAEPLRAQGHGRADAAGRIPRLLELVGLEAAHADRFPHEFSGGQRQRIGIARALAVEPELLVLDEPVSALDVSVQAGVLNLLQRLKRELGLAYLFVSHDLAVVRHIADRVSVMYLGRTVESGPVEEVFARPRHPYTQALLSAVPVPDPSRERARERILLAGDPPSPAVRDEGCRFRGRCPLYAALGDAERSRCEGVRPAPRSLGGDQVAACHFAAG